MCLYIFLGDSLPIDESVRQESSRVQRLIFMHKSAHKLCGMVPIGFFHFGRILQKKSLLSASVDVCLRNKTMIPLLILIYRLNTNNAFKRPLTLARKN